MKKNDLIIITSVMLVSILGVLLYTNHKNKKRIEEELRQKQKDHLNLLNIHLNSIENNPSLISILASQIENLKNEYSDVRPDIAKKLKEVLDLLNTQKDEIAIEKLTLIIENLLKEKYEEENSSEQKKKTPPLYDLLKVAKEKKWITKHHFNFSNFLREKRNKIAHELNSNINKNERYLALFAGIEIIYHLSGIRRID